MISDDRAGQLHDRATRGQALTVEEQTLLEQWYARQDQEESASLGGSPASADVAGLRGQVDEAVVRLLEATKRLQALGEENEAVRREIAALQAQLAERSTAQSA